MDDILKTSEKNQKNFRPLPFWSWNDELAPTRLTEQVRSMKQAGLGGFFMHARVGLKTPYMESEWFNCVKACIDEAVSCELFPWGYDENGYPSGIAGGAVCDASEDYRSSWIELISAESLEELSENKVLALYRFSDNDWIRCEADEFSSGLAVVNKNETRAADPMNKEAVDLFIKLTHEKYKEQLGDMFGKEMPGFFTDEPQLKQYQLPWSKDFDLIFKELYGYDLLGHIPALRYDTVSGKEGVRHDYWTLINRLYCEGFGKRVYDWCQCNGCMVTGHVMAEDTLLEQMGSNGGAMPYYRFMDIPGMDWLGRRIGSPVAVKQVASVSMQTGRRRVLSETFALSGWDVSFKELKWIAEWQMSQGVNLLCPHLQSYSLRGIRKRDYPASLFIQEPWWEQYPAFTDYISALGSILGSSDECCDLLVIHPLHSAHILYNGRSDCAAVKELDAEFASLSEELQHKHIPYHYGDETVLKEYGEIGASKLKVGKTAYTKVLLPGIDNILSSTVELLEAFIKSGGKVYTAGRLPVFIDGRPGQSELLKRCPCVNDFKSLKDSGDFSVSVTENGEECAAVITSLWEKGPEKLCFLFNSDINNSVTVTCKIRGMSELSRISLPEYSAEPIDYSSEEDSISAVFTLKGGESLLLLNKDALVKKEAGSVVTIPLPKTLHVAEADLNALTLDACEYSVAEGQWQPSMPLILLQKKLLDAQTDADIMLKFGFYLEMNELPCELFVVSENIPAFTLFVNGHEVNTESQDFYIDPDFKKVNIAPFVKNGQNEMILKGRFYQRKPLYDYLYREKDLSSNHYAVDFEFEAVTYDVEIESVYLLGDFTVLSKSPYVSGERRSVSAQGPFVLAEPCKNILAGDITVQGFPFFAGKMTLDFAVELNKKTGERYILDMEKPNCPAAVLTVNGKDARLMVWEPCVPDLTELLVDGENKISITLFSGLRNLLGPHHFKYGESYFTGVSTFADQPGWCEDIEGISGNIWDERYHFVRFGIAENGK